MFFSAGIIASGASPYLMASDVLSLRLVCKSMMYALGSVRELTLEDSPNEKIQQALSMFHKLRIIRVLHCPLLNVRLLEHALAACVDAKSMQVVYDLHLHELSLDLESLFSSISCETRPEPLNISDGVSWNHSFSTGSELKVLVVRTLAPGQSENLLLWLCGLSPDPQLLRNRGWGLGLNDSLLELHITNSVDFSSFHCGAALSLCTQLLVLDVSNCGLLTALGPLLNVVQTPLIINRIIAGTGFVFDSTAIGGDKSPGSRFLKLRVLKIINCCLFQLDCSIPSCVSIGQDRVVSPTLSASQLCYIRELNLSGSNISCAQCSDILLLSQQTSPENCTESTRGVCCFPFLQRLVLSGCTSLEGTLRLNAHTQLTDLVDVDLSFCPRLRYLYVVARSLRVLSLTGSSSLTSLYFCSDEARDLDLRMLGGLKLVQLGECPRLRRVDLTGSHMALPTRHTTAAVGGQNSKTTTLCNSIDNWLGRRDVREHVRAFGNTTASNVHSVDFVMDTLVLPTFLRSKNESFDEDDGLISSDKCGTESADCIVIEMIRACICKVSTAPDCSIGDGLGRCVHMKQLQLKLLTMDSSDGSEVPRIIVGMDS